MAPAQTRKPPDPDLAPRPSEEEPERLRVFFDADVLIAGSATRSPTSASHILLQLAELTLIEGLICPYVREEAERNLQEKLPQGLPVFRALLRTVLREVPDPTKEELAAYEGRAEAEDVPVLAAAAREGCAYLVTFNVRDYPKPPEGLQVVEPGELVRRVRAHLARMLEGEGEREMEVEGESEE